MIRHYYVIKVLQSNLIFFLSRVVYVVQKLVLQVNEFTLLFPLTFKFNYSAYNANLFLIY
jgi:hypothetical protein